MASLSGISFGGLSSGIDTDGIISRLIQLEQIPVARLQQRQAEIQNQQAVYGQFRSKLQALSSTAGALNSSSVFNPVTAASSKTDVATITAGSDAIAGIYNLTVSKLAQAHKVSSVAQADSTSALNKTGQFVVNGKAIQVDATDSLRSIAQKVNSAGAGVTASIIDGGTGSNYLTFTANNTGAKNKVQLADLSGNTILSDLGVVSGATAIRETITNGATSVVFGKNNEAVGTMMNGQALGPASFTVNGVTVNVDLSTDNLQTVANAINSAVTGVNASVRSITENGATTYKLDIAGTAGTPTFADVTGNALAAMGVIQQGFGNPLVTAQDASYSLDGVPLTSASNTITTAIPNATLTLLKANETTPETSTLSLTKDTAAVQAKVGAFKDAYNDAIDFIRTYSQFDKDTFASGPLFGDPVAGQLEQQISSMIFTNVPGLTGSHQNLTSIGFNIDEAGKLTLDESVLTTALSSAPDDVANLFKTSGLGSTGEIQYISSTPKTVSSGAGSYSVDITTLATKGSYMGETAQTTNSAASEILTFNGAMFGTTAYTLSISSGSSAADTVNRINGDSKLKDLVLASIDGSGKLLIESKKFGTGGNLTVTSNLAAATDNSGIGLTSLGTTVSGVNVAGTINGEAATGNGQYLIGNTGNATTDGLQIQYTGNTLGIVGNISLRKGMGTQANDLMATFLDSVNGILTASDNTLKAQFDDLDDQIDSLNDRIVLKETDLRLKFARMEEAISKIQSQASRLSSLTTSNSG
jgi:flagellar hook-associated protein 2